MKPVRATQRLSRGFTLVEVMIVCMLLGVLAAVALPAFKRHTLRAGRLDAVEALMKVQAAQEQHRALHGLYAHELTALRGISPASTQGLYAVSLDRTGADAFVATATARGRQADDGGCAQITLRVLQGFPTEGPAPECWQR